MKRPKDSAPQDVLSTPAESSQSAIGRRAFLRGAAMASASLVLLPELLQAGNGTNPACAPTTPDIEGPYYIAGAPMQVALAHGDEPGERLAMSGRVYASDCTTPIVGAMVDVWAANDAGCYNNNHECSPHNDDVYNLRGRMLTDANGAYSYSTVKPGRYLNGGTFRPSHIHYKISVPGFPLVTTQLYFEGDPYIASDPWASTPAASARIIPLATSQSGLSGVFDIVLDIEQAAGVTDASAPAGHALVSAAPNPFIDATTIVYHIAAPARVVVAVFDMTGRRVRTLVDAMHGAGVFSEEWDGRGDDGTAVATGVYTCRFQAGSFVATRKLMPIR